MEQILTKKIIKNFLNNFKNDQKMLALQYILIIGIEYIGNFSYETTDLFYVLKRIASSKCFYFKI